MPELLYVIGVPGAGKTTLVREVLGAVPYGVAHKPFAHRIYGPGRVQWGEARQLFGGTDTLSMSVAPVAQRALREQPWTHVLAEGDRLATYRFFDYVRALPMWHLRVVWLQVGLDVAAERRVLRGTTQDAQWIAGRVRKVYQLARQYDPLILDGERWVEAVAVLRRETVIQALRGEL